MRRPTEWLLLIVFHAIGLLAAFVSVAANVMAEERLVEPLDMEMVRRNGGFGYSEAEIEKYFSTPLAIELDATGMNRSLLSPPPPPGVHPRVLFNPVDLPDIRRRLEGTACGRLVMGNIRKHLDKQFRDPKSPLTAQYDELAAGRLGAPADADPNRSGVGFVLLYECFRCLIDDDAAGGRKAAAAVATLAGHVEARIDAEIAKQKDPAARDDFRIVAQGPTFEGTLGLMYDFTHRFMDDAQRKAVRRAVAKGSAGMTFVGCETLRSLTTNTSNWSPWSARMLFLCCAIEGEDGHDPAAYERCVAAVTGNVGTIYPGGEAFEGWGKNFMFLEHLAIVAKRGKNLLSSRNLRDVFRNYYIAAMDPWGGRYTFYDSINGTGSRISRNADVVLYHQVFPDDAAGALCYRSQVLEGYEALTEKDRINTRHPFALTDPLICAIYACDVDRDEPWEKALERVTEGRPLSQFSEDTCNLITRSSWSPDALFMTYQNRAVMGGHLYADRSHFNLYADGRYWALYRTLRQAKEHYKPGNRSVVMIDGQGPSTPPARCVAFADAALATFIATDLAVPWNFSSNYIEPAKERGKTVSLPYDWNHFRLHPSPLPWMDLPVEGVPNWLSSRKPEPLGKNPAPFIGWTPRRPGIKRAYRTAGLVRGPHPYALVVDDIQLDAKIHDYTWNLTIADDVTLGTARRVGGSDWPMAELILEEKSPPPGGKKRRLLVRFLEARGLLEEPATIETVTLPDGSNGKPMIFPKLVVRSKAVAPNFKAVLVPLRDGQQPPKTTWSHDHAALTVSWPDQTDTIAFSPHADGRSRLAIVREGATILDWATGAEDAKR